MDALFPETKKLNELYASQSDFSTAMDGVWTTFANLFPNSKPITAEKTMINTAIWEWYNDNLTFTDNTTDFIAEMQTMFDRNVLSVLAKLRQYRTIYTDLDKLYVKGGFTSQRTSTIDRTDTDTRTDTRSGSLTSQNEGGNTAFTKQADTPTIQSPSTSFVDSYTDYQSKTENETDLKTTTTYNNLTSTKGGAITIDDDEQHDTTLARTGSTEDALKVFSYIPKSIFEPLYEAISPMFVSIYFI